MRKVGRAAGINMPRHAWTIIRRVACLAVAVRGRRRRFVAVVAPPRKEHACTDVDGLLGAVTCDGSYIFSTLRLVLVDARTDLDERLKHESYIRASGSVTKSMPQPREGTDELHLLHP